ncbi:amidohydrolase family protein [Hydrocarboniphaga effusa]|uniref:amidohydrolase family protein n=1 Tax=Hydrocarboniphaga effusa TaxID=243629 RepID=UPI00192B7010|nr:amidohydrolase family protein [Hydrocarboniphaga effusa]
MTWPAAGSTCLSRPVSSLPQSVDGDRPPNHRSFQSWSPMNLSRRAFIESLGSVALSAIAAPVSAGERTAVPHSAGTERPRSRAPAHACDAHLHIADARFRHDFPQRFGGATFNDYRKLQQRIGVSRAVIVQTKIHGVDHACLLDALKQLGPNGRGIGVVTPEVDQAELLRLDAGGVRGLRFSVWNPADAFTTLDMVEPLARRIADLGWHVQIHAMADQIVDAAPLLNRLPCPIVFDHMGRLPPAQGADHPAFGVICRLMDQRKAWVKLTGAYLNTTQGPPDYPDATRIARAFVAQAPDRLVWGSDWPHATEATPPDDARLFDLLGVWAGDEATRSRILVDNPVRLYGFARADAA